MTNEFGQALDRNGYAPSVVTFPEGKCLICGRTDRPLQRHEVFHGPYREKSKRYGCWVLICDSCHSKVHKGGDMEIRLKGVVQRKAMKAFGWTLDKWREVFGKSYGDTV